MKNFIVTIALIILASVMLVCQEDVNIMQRQSFLAKDTTDQMAAAAGTAIQNDMYGEGFIYFDYDEGVRRAAYTLQENRVYSSAYMPGGNYYSDPATVYVYFFDDSLVGQCYRNGTFQRAFSFSYGDHGSTYIPDVKDDFTISQACVFCSFDAGKPRLRLTAGINRGHIKKESVYEYLD